jgi:hypothetical protein
LVRFSENSLKFKENYREFIENFRNTKNIWEYTKFQENLRIFENISLIFKMFSENFIHWK